MPHDKKGQLLQAGDRVSLIGSILSIDSEQETFCNIRLLCDSGMEPKQDGKGYDEGGYTLTLSARMVEKLELATTEQEPSIEVKNYLGRFADEIRNRAEAHANNALRNRSEFERHEVKLALISAFITGADMAGHATQAPAHEQGTALETAQADLERTLGELRTMRQERSDLLEQLNDASKEIERLKAQPFTMKLSEPGEVKTPEDEKARQEILGTGDAGSAGSGQPASTTTINKGPGADSQPADGAGQEKPAVDPAPAAQ